MKTSALKYSRFAFNNVFKKKSSIIIPSLLIGLSLIMGLIFRFTIDHKYFNLTTYIYIFFVLVATVIFSSIKALNIFKDFEQEGMEIVSLSKPISRNNLVLGKLITLIYFGLIWAIVSSLSSLLFLNGFFNARLLFTYSGLFLIVVFCTYMFIGLITALIGYKLNQKFAITIPLALFIPLALGGSLLSANATSNANNAAYYINTKYPYHLSGNEANVEPFFINNKKDELILIPNGLQNDKFSKKQIEYLEEVMNISNKSSSEWQIYSWLSTPYQLLDIFNFNNNNVFEVLSKNKFTNQNNYIYYNGLDDITYQYKLEKNVNWKKYDSSNSGILEKRYIVPGLLKSNSIIPNTIGTSIIYARENASNTDVDFPEDSAQFSAENNLVGKLNWKYVYEALRDKNFNLVAKRIIDNIEPKLTNNNRTIAHKELMNEISILINDLSDNSIIYELENFHVTIFNKNSIIEKKIQSEIERKIYIAVALLNYIYFNKQNSYIYESMIVNPNKINEYGNSQIVINFGGFKYLIGGFSSYDKKVITVQREKMDTHGNVEKDGDGKPILISKIVLRYDLTPSNSNFLFKATEDVYAINRSKKIVNKNVYYVLWIILILILFVSVFYLYKRRDYK
ncbi:ABC transporter permease [Metamycoplasma phocicerebrale]|uniref:ABC transporter permease n=1 Tax=Metamycoplasma phocicerebrale TaxID=142649 RepID=A0A3T0TTF1_9BACT|nr:ABC transporter permease [Metamycoplasma phocicerebrale]AZZ65371.1 ABC transporter permease [Metamycoplasma phocicerebrale]